MPKLTLGFKAMVNVYGSLCMSALHRRIRCLVAMMLPPRWNTGIYNKNITLQNQSQIQGKTYFAQFFQKVMDLIEIHSNIDSQKGKK